MSEKKKYYTTEVFEINRDSKAKVLINVGGAGSSKSYSIAQLLVYRMLTEKNKVFGITRKTFPALRMTSMLVILGLLKEYGVYDEGCHNKTANTYRCGTNVAWFFSVDEADKIKSTQFNYEWLEEADEFTWDDYLQLKLRLRAPTVEGEPNQMILSLNPANAFGWIPRNLCGVTSGGSVSG